MEKRGDDTVTIKRRRSESPSSSLPIELSSEILSKLPAKAVVRFRCVSKLWSSVTREPYFIKSFEARRSLLFFFKEGEKFFVFSINQHNPNPNESYSYSNTQPMDSFNIKFPKNCCFATKSESVHGLICFYRSTNPIIWNPSMRKFSILPNPDDNWGNKTFHLGYDPTERKHKVVSLCNDGKSQFKRFYNDCQVLTLGSDQEGSWKTVKTNHYHRALTSHHTVNGRCINGVLYYQAYIEHYVRVIMSFDIKSEKLELIEMPSWSRQICHMVMIAYEEKIAFVDSTGDRSITIWVLEDAKKHEWSNRNFPFPQNDKHFKKAFKLAGITDGGELIYVQKTFLQSFDVVYIDPKKETFRRVAYRGIVDGDTRRRNGLDPGKRLRGLSFFPNHIQTFTSL